jgi:peptide/nickel transport system substrate-binding protein
MKRGARTQLDQLRRSSGEVHNQLIDDLLSGESDRREFLQRASIFGLGLPAIGIALGAVGETPVAFGAVTRGKAGGRLRLGINPAPGGAIEPILFADTGSLCTGSVCGEFLTRATANLQVKPELALSWTPNKNATVWTYKLRPNVKFQSGQTMTAADVIATYKNLLSAKSQALSAFKGVLSPDGITQGADPLTVIFKLDAPTASFPYLTSSTTYNAIILPADYVMGTFTSKPQTTGAYQLTNYVQGQSVTYDRFPGWWGGTAPLDGVDGTYYSTAAAADAALLSGSLDLYNEITQSSDRALFNNPKVQVFSTRSAGHREIPMRTDIAPFNDYRIRQAVALTLDRPAIIKTLLNGLGDLGNDSPFAPVFPSTSPVPQRKKNLAKAKQLMAAAAPKGFSTTVTVQGDLEIPAYAQILQRSVKDIGIKMAIKSETDSVYFAGTAKTTPWLNTPINITGWGARAVPDVYLTSDYHSGGVWNAAHYNSKAFDALAKSYLAAISLADKRKYSKQIEQLLLHDTPLIISYFSPTLAAGSKSIKGYYVGPNNDVYLSHTTMQ